MKYLNIKKKNSQKFFRVKKKNKILRLKRIFLSLKKKYIYRNKKNKKKKNIYKNKQLKKKQLLKIN
jgi:hypothetical protein